MTLDEIKKRLQGHLSDGLLVVVGSGLSCAEGLPGMPQLAQHLMVAVKTGCSELDETTWSDISLKLLEVGLESSLMNRELSMSLAESISTATGNFIAVEERRVITEIFGGNRELRLTRLLKHVLIPQSGLVIVTTNYDRLVEIAVEEMGAGADTMFAGKLSGLLNERESKFSFCRGATYKKQRVTLNYKPRVAIYKPHGSLDWYLRNGQPMAYAGELGDIARLIITPGQNKFRNGYNSPFDIHRSRANEAIDKAGRFLIIGYGFNDDHLETHLSPAIKSGKPTLMLTQQLSSNAHKLALEHGNVIALDCYSDGVRKGTRLIINKVQQLLPDLNIWDVHKFIDEVLEP